MKANLKDRRLQAALALLLAGVASAASVAPVQAQASSRFRVLVPALVGNKSGTKVADLVRKNIDQMNTHVSIPEKEVKAAIKKVGVKEDQMDCLKYRQLMSQIDPPAKLVMCGAIENGQVAAQFYSPDGSSYDVPPFPYTTEAAAAEQIQQAFGHYVQMLSKLSFCDDYLNSSQWQDALTQCSEAIELNPKSGHALYGRGSALRAMGRHDEALAAFQKVLDVDPLNQDAMMSAAVESAALGQEEQSSKYWKDYLELNPGDAQVRLSIASKAANEGDFRGALTIVEGVEGADTANAVLREYSGHFAMGAAGRIVNANPSSEIPDAAKELFAKAIQNYTFVVNARPDSISGIVLRNLMVANGALGNTDEALAWGQRAVQSPDADAQTWSAYADQLRIANHPEEALAALDKVTQLDPDYAVSARRAVILLDLNRLTDAVAAVKQAGTKNELSPEQQDNIAQRLIKTGYENFQKAKQYNQAFVYYDNSRAIATTAKTRAMANYLQGYGLYEQARTIQDKSTVQSARESLPMFERAKTMLQNSTAYSDNNADSSRASLLKAIDQLIEIQNLIIKKGS